MENQRATFLERTHEAFLSNNSNQPCGRPVVVPLELTSDSEKYLIIELFGFDLRQKIVHLIIQALACHLVIQPTTRHAT
jgi:hypothetical protein